MRLRVLLGLVLSLALGLPPAPAIGALAAAGPPPPGYPTAEKVRPVWRDADARRVVLRRGFYDHVTGRGFGWDKLYHRHNITNTNLVKFVTKEPSGGEPQGTARVYHAWSHYVECGRVVCTIKDRTQVRMVVEYGKRATIGGWPAGNPVGVLTGYCVDPRYNPKCPWWVSDSRFIPSVAAEYSWRADRGRHRAVGTVWSYEPLGKVGGVAVPVHAVTD